MKKRRKICGILFVGIYFFIMVGIPNSLLASSGENISHPFLTPQGKTPGGNVIYRFTNVGLMERTLSIPKILEVDYIDFSRKKVPVVQSSSQEKEKYHLSHISKAEVCLFGKDKMSSKLFNSAGNKAVLEKSFSGKYQHSYYTSVPVSLQRLQSDLGFSVGHSFSIEDYFPVTVPSHESRNVQIYPRARHYEFSIVDHEGKVVGYGTADEIMGVCVIVH